MKNEKNPTTLNPLPKTLKSKNPKSQNPVTSRRAFAFPPFDMFHRSKKQTPGQHEANDDFSDLSQFGVSIPKTDTDLEREYRALLEEAQDALDRRDDSDLDLETLLMMPDDESVQDTLDLDDIDDDTEDPERLEGLLSELGIHDTIESKVPPMNATTTYSSSTSSTPTQIEIQIQHQKQTVLTYKRQGQMDFALEALRELKHLEAKVLAISSSSIDTSKTPEIVMKSQPLEERIQCQKQRALRLKRSGDIEGAVKAMQHLRALEAQEEEIQVSRDDLVDPSWEKALQALNDDHEEQSATDIDVFQNIELKLVQYANQAMKDAKHLCTGSSSSKSGGSSSNREIVQMLVNQRKYYVEQLERVKVQREKQLGRPPRLEKDRVTMAKEVRNESLEPNEMQVELTKITISDSDSVKQLLLQAKHIYLVCYLGKNMMFTSATFSLKNLTKNTPGIADPRKPPNVPSTTTIPLDIRERVPLKRSRGTTKTFEIRKASFEIWTPRRSIFHSPRLLAKSSVELKHLLTHSTWAGVSTSSSRIAGSTSSVQLHLALRLQSPLVQPQMSNVIFETLKVSYDEELMDDDAHVGNTVSPGTSPSHRTDMDWYRLGDIMSYDVLSYELEKQGVTAAHRQVLEEKKSTLEIEMTNGTLTLEQYLQLLQQQMQHDQKLVTEWLELGYPVKKVNVLRKRIHIMMKEIRSATSTD